MDSAHRALADAPDWKESIAILLQTPFDFRVFPNDARLIDWGRWTFYERTGPDTIGLCLARKIDTSGAWNYAFVAAGFISHHGLSMKEVNYWYPSEIDGSENLSLDFRDFIDTRYDHHYSPEEILGYIYAILHAPTYRRRYAEFLRIDFPRVPFTETRDQFDVLSALGWELVQVHLLKTRPRSGDRLGDYVDQRPKGERGEHLVDRG